MVYRIYSILFLGLVAFTGCQTNEIYSESKDVDSPWNYSESIVFDLPAKDSTEMYDLVIEIDHSPEFSFENFYTKITTKFPSGESTDDLASFELANNLGTWLGDCSSKSCSYELLLKPNFSFTEVGNHKLIFENNSRTELEGIQRIELKLLTVETE